MTDNNFVADAFFLPLTNARCEPHESDDDTIAKLDRY